MMDNVRGQDDIETDETFDNEAIEAPPVIDAAERRMHVRAYNYWVSLLGNRALPSIEDLNPEDMEDFSSNSVLLDFSMGMENPAIIYLGAGLREECGIEGPIERADEVPARSLLSRLTDHYLQIIANAAPVGFEAEFTNQRDAEIMYRGILMPFSSDDETIDFIYGVINWKEMAAQGMMDALGEEVQAALSAGPAPAAEPSPIWADGPSATSDFEDEDEAGLPLRDIAALDADDFGFESVEAVAETNALPETDLEEAVPDDGLPSLEVLDTLDASSEDIAADMGFDLVEDIESGSHEDMVDELSLADDNGFIEADADKTDSEPEASEEAVLDELDLTAFIAEDPNDSDSDTLIDNIESDTAEGGDAFDDILALSAEDLLETEVDSATETAKDEPDDASEDFGLDALDALPDIEIDTVSEAGTEPESHAEILAEPEMETEHGLDALTGLEAEPGTEHANEAETEPGIETVLEDVMDIAAFAPTPDMGSNDSAAAMQDDATMAVATLAAAGPAADLPPITDVLDPAEHADGLAGALDVARQSAAQASDADARSRTALYRAIGHAHDFALATREAPADYAAMLEEAGIIVQERSPMTAIAKLVFGAGYDKSRLAEYALALDYALHEGIEKGALAGQLGFYEGGLKGLVRDVRAARKAGEPSRGARSLERAYRKISKAQRLDAGSLNFDEQGVTLIVARREHDGSVSFVACADTQDKAAQKTLIVASKSI